jgi:CRP-like cAMP-binding protein
MGSGLLPASLGRYGHEIAVREGRAFCYQDDPCAEAFFLLEGSVRPVKFSAAGKPFDLPPLGRGSWFGIAELVSGGAYLFDAVASAQCRALSFSRANLDLALRDPEAARAVLAALASCVVAAHRALADEDAGRKVLSYLLARRHAPGMPSERSRLMLTQSALAEAVGLARETVNRQLRELESLGFVSTGRGEITVHDWDALAARYLEG